MATIATPAGIPVAAPARSVAPATTNPAAPAEAAPAPAAPANVASRQATEMNVADKKADLAAAVRGPGLTERIARAEEASNKAWDRVGNAETWKKAGVTKEEMAGIAERSKKAALAMVGGNEKSPMLGEASFIAQANELATWAEGAAGAGRGTSKESAQAMRDMQEGGTDYVRTRSEWIALQREQQQGQR